MMSDQSWLVGLHGAHFTVLTSPHSHAFDMSSNPTSSYLYTNHQYLSLLSQLFNDSFFLGRQLLKIRKLASSFGFGRLLLLL